MKACDGCSKQDICSNRISKSIFGGTIPSCVDCKHLDSDIFAFPCNTCRAVDFTRTVCNFVPRRK